MGRDYRRLSNVLLCKRSGWRTIAPPQLPTRPRDRPSRRVPRAVPRRSNYDFSRGSRRVRSSHGAGSALQSSCPSGGQSRSMSDAQPSGTVTLVFTDVEGSTKLLEELGTDALSRRARRAPAGRPRGVRAPSRLRSGLRGGRLLLRVRLRAGRGLGGERGDGRLGDGSDPHPRRHPHRRACSRPAQVRGHGRAPRRAGHERRARRAGGALAIDGLAARAGVVRAASTSASTA